MRKVVLKIFILVWFLFSIDFVDADGFSTTSGNIILYNMNDGSILYEEQEDERIQIASLTKIMTAIVALENIDNLEEEVVMTSEMFQGIEDYSKMGLKVGDRISYLDLLYGVMLPSGADAVNGLVFSLVDNADSFISLMNKKVNELGLKNTHFDNAIGMDSADNYSSVLDVSKILQYALENEVFKKIFTTREIKIDSLSLTLKSTLLGYSKSYGLNVDDITGAKSGYTDGAGLCLASTASIDGVNYLLVVAGADTSNRANAIKDTLAIYNYYASNYSYQTVIEKNQILKKLKVKWGHTKEYQVKMDRDTDLYLENGLRKSRLKYTYDGVEEITARIKKGDKLGTITVYYENQVLGEYDVYMNEDLEFYHPVLYILIVVLFIIMISSLLKIRENFSRR